VDECLNPSSSIEREREREREQKASETVQDCGDDPFRKFNKCKVTHTISVSHRFYTDTHTLEKAQAEVSFLHSTPSLSFSDAL